MLKILSGLLLALLLVGCGPHHVDYFPFHDDGTMKPHIALIPVVDTSNSDVPWCLAQEMTLGLRYQMMDDGELYLLSRSEMNEGLPKTVNVNLFGDDLSYAKGFRNTDFVVAAELIEHKIYPYDKEVHKCLVNTTGFVLTMRMRIRIIDVRCEEPRILLQEIVKSDRVIPRMKDCDFNLIPYGAEHYTSSPCGAAHHFFFYKIAKRVEDTTWGAK